MRGIIKLDIKLQKEAKHKYKSFMLHNHKMIKEVNGNLETTDNPYLIQNTQDLDDDAASRENTPNPWEQHRKRQIKKARMAENLTKISTHQTEQSVQQALSYLNYDI